MSGLAIARKLWYGACTRDHPPAGAAPRGTSLRLNDMLHATNGQMDFRIFAFVVWRKFDGDVACLAPFWGVVDATDEAGGAAMTADDDHRAGRWRIIRNAFSEKQFRVWSGVHDEPRGRALIFDIDSPTVVRFCILLFRNMLITIFVTSGMRWLRQFRLKRWRPCSEIMEQQINVVFGYGFDVEDVEQNAVAEADGAVEKDVVVGFVAFPLGDAVFIVLLEQEQLTRGGGL